MERWRQFLLCQTLVHQQPAGPDLRFTEVNELQNQTSLLPVSFQTQLLALALTPGSVSDVVYMCELCIFIIPSVFFTLSAGKTIQTSKC